MRSPSSATQDHISPLTPESYFPPAPTIVTPDEFTLQLDVQFDNMVGGSPHKPSIAHLLPQPLVPSSKSDPSFLSEDDLSKVQVSLKSGGRWENTYDHCESSPPLRPRNAPRTLPVSQDSASDALSWEATHSALVNPNEFPDPSRYSLLINEVSLLVGLAADDDHHSPGDCCPLVPDGSKQVPDILPLSLTPTKSLAPRKHRNASHPAPTNTTVQVHPPSIPISPSINPIANNANATLHNEKPRPVRSRGLVTSIPRHKGADAVRPSLSPRRRQGQVFHFEPPINNAYHRNAVDLDETFVHPREPPPKPTPDPPANRCSSLDRLECSLRKLEAHAPSNHRKSQSEGWSPVHVVQRKDKRPSLPPPQRLKKQQSTREIVRRNPSHQGVDCHFSSPPPPVPRLIPPHQYVVPRSCPGTPLDDEYREEDHTPGSFMDMDIPLMEETSEKRQASFRQVTSKEKMKSLVNMAKRVSRGVIAWGKNLTGSTKPSVNGQEITTVQSTRV